MKTYVLSYRKILCILEYDFTNTLENNPFKSNTVTTIYTEQPVEHVKHVTIVELAAYRQANL